MGLFEQMGIDDQEEGVYDDFPADFDLASLEETQESSLEELEETVNEDYPVEDYEEQDSE